MTCDIVIAQYFDIYKTENVYSKLVIAVTASH